MANVGDVRTSAELFHTALKENSLPNAIRYYSRIIGDASPAAAEVFINGVENSRFYLPDNSHVVAYLLCSAWNVTDGDAPTGAIISAMIENDGGTVAIVPADIDPTATFTDNPISRFVGETGGTFAVTADNTNKALGVTFTPTANDTYEVSAVLYYCFSAADLKNPNFYTATN